MIRLRHVPLPNGLSAFVRRGGSGDIEVFVSAALPPGRQRTAVRAALAASRQAGWRAGLVPAPLVALVAAGRACVRGAGHVLRAHLLATGAAAAATVAVASGAVLIAVVPHHAGPAVSTGRLPAPSRVRSPAAARPAVPQPSAGRRLPVSGTGPPVAARSAAPSPQPSVAAATSPAPTPQPSSSPPSAVPSPAPSSGGRSSCVVLLGLEICL